jgi:hypothetical protein
MRLGFRFRHQSGDLVLYLKLPFLEAADRIVIGDAAEHSPGGSLAQVKHASP